MVGGCRLSVSIVGCGGWWWKLLVGLFVVVLMFINVRDVVRVLLLSDCGGSIQERERKKTFLG